MEEHEVLEPKAKLNGYLTEQSSSGLLKPRTEIYWQRADGECCPVSKNNTEFVF